ncbi:polar tube protein Ptp2 [Encephalitozoon romaleae SJ-2008]|uniref:Polar tube protein Ptp2 n=1 Tax=Encephalitozoon romaleae (strain SJ-2008) TaxID=1178016 RepID=I7AEK9_ENCRO|nr:polar tube protein Ptp2 [Encephalitozoon romaleae SJ-2008]AFN83110.1 polar tube protein Ptp2 [Encephalitozoon romaleae SJ-2008]
MLLLFTVVTLVSTAQVPQTPASPQTAPTQFLPGVQQKIGGVDNRCANKQVEGVQIFQGNMAECLKRNSEAANAMFQRAKQRALEIYNKEVSKGPTPKDSGQCIERAVQGTDRCILAKIIDKAVNMLKYRISKVGNATALFRGNKLISLILNVDYGLKPFFTVVKKKTKRVFPSGDELNFNGIGQLIGVKGTFPQDNNDECKPCDSPKKTVETVAEECNLGCQLKGTPGLISKAIQKKDTKESSKDGEKGSAQNGEGTTDDEDGQQSPADGNGPE